MMDHDGSSTMHDSMLLVSEEGTYRNSRGPTQVPSVMIKSHFSRELSVEIKACPKKKHMESVRHNKYHEPAKP